MKTALWFFLFGTGFVVGGVLSHAPWPALFGVAGLLVGFALLSQARQNRQDQALAQRMMRSLDRM